MKADYLLSHHKEISPAEPERFFDKLTLFRG